MKITRVKLTGQITTALATLWLAIQPIIAHAAETPPVFSTPDAYTPTTNNLDTIKNNYYDTVVNTLYWFVGVAAVIYIVWNGIQYIMSNGDAEKAKKARNAIINAVIGIVIVVSLYAIINLAFGISKTIQTTNP